LAEADPAYRDRLERFLRRCREDDLRVAAAAEDGGELLIFGLAQTIVEMNGVPDATHIRDLPDTTADAYGGWAYATGQLAAGGQYAQRLVTMRHFDMQHAKSLARRILEPAVADEGQDHGAIGPD
jgi:hypothetical protein